jgi:hypothetical protein
MKQIIAFMSLIFILCLSLPIMATAADEEFVTAPDKMTWSEAKAYCASMGSRLPLIDGKNVLAAAPEILAGIPDGTPIDGFGSMGGAWPSGLPDASYWTDTEISGAPGYSWGVYSSGGKVDAFYDSQSDTFSVMCLP